MILALDVETSMSPKMFPWVKGSYLSLVVAIEEDKDGNRTNHHWVFNHNSVGLRPQQQLVDEIQNVLDRASLVVGHNWKFDLHWMKHLGIKPPKCFDTMVAEYLIVAQNNLVSISLAETAKRYGLDPKLDAVKAYWDSGIDTAAIPLETLVEYCIRDTELTLNLYHKQLPKIAELGLGKLLKIHNHFVECLQEIEQNGMKVDLTHLEEQIEIFQAKLADVNKRYEYFIVDNLPELRDIPYSLTSSDHLSAILYGGIIKYDSTEMVTREYKTKPSRTYERACTKEFYTAGIGFTPRKSDATKKPGYYKTNKEVLATLPAKNKRTTEFLAIVREQSDVSKILSTYLLGIQKLIPEDSDTAHPPFNNCLTVTGRLTSFFQTLPRGSTDLTKIVKQMFIPKSADRVIMNGDLSSLEWNGACQLSGDKVMLNEIVDKVDAHTMNSNDCFGSPDFRQEAKVISFRSIYGGGAYAFFMDSRMPKKTLPEWEEIHAKFYQKYKRLGEWQNEMYKLVCQQGWYSSFTGRRYVFHKREGTYVRPAVCNYIVQGTSTGDIVPFVMLLIRKQIRDEELDANLICQVHDSVVLDVAIKDADRVAEIIWTQFNNLPQTLSKFFGYNYFVPMTGEVEAGMNYKDLKKLFGKEGRVAYVSEVLV
jgi:DNA polymerase-1